MATICDLGLLLILLWALSMVALFWASIGIRDEIRAARTDSKGEAKEGE